MIRITQKDLEINVFSRFFGNMLVELKKHDPRLRDKTNAGRPYVQEFTPTVQIDNITYVR